ncbi:hypothetical protein IT397_02610 [Candidatus Nomurabacteria bacterium]|nr:hypothetical protein [Candidatus Nomurabacteria bacterium]
MFKSAIFSEGDRHGERETVKFTIDGEGAFSDMSPDEEHKPRVLEVWIQFVGVPSQVRIDPLVKPSGENFGFIAVRRGYFLVKEGKEQAFNVYYYVGVYNTRSRCGACYEFAEGEFLKSPVAQVLYWGKTFEL